MGVLYEAKYFSSCRHRDGWERPVGHPARATARRRPPRRRRSGASRRRDCVRLRNYRADGVRLLIRQLEPAHGGGVDVDAPVRALPSHGNGGARREGRTPVRDRPARSPAPRAPRCDRRRRAGDQVRHAPRAAHCRRLLGAHRDRARPTASRRRSPHSHGRRATALRFLLWECAYAELWFTERMWPDFGAPHLAAAIHEFHSRDRRFGGLPTREAV